ncbi:MAG TPA: glycosyltransferase family 2 protein [Solirubrobacteraceae bacterium]|jgi:GT2 family glycosyltransferase|nr:glycosyltransferase family 2 protein [Solirubrobacteraceae bacterium]
MDTRADVVIPVHGGYPLTDSCLRHLAAQTVAHEVTIVDNGSRDDTLARLREQWPAVRVLEMGANRGFTQACNRGVARGQAPLVVLLNNDVDCRPDFLERLLAPLRADPRVGSATPLLLRPGELQIDSAGLATDVTLAGFPRLRGEPLSRAPSPSPRLLGPTGAAAAYRRTAWEQCGGLDERITAYQEDLDLALRLRAAGWPAAAALDAVAVHLGSASYGHRSARQRRLAGFSRGYLLRRYRVLHGRHAARTLATEALVSLADVATCRDLDSLAGRLAGWRAARGVPANERPPAAAIDEQIGLLRSLRLRRAVAGAR